MKLPFKGDPGGDAEGALLRADVLEVLFEYGVSVSPGKEDDSASLEKGDIVEVQNLPQVVGGKMIRYLARKFEIPITAFYISRKSKLH
ncbi:MAG: hypothetical protein MN733_26815 [Nitrososphaera sp.]|nr:hypothetical protein [Nitrososphaera sp.]